jgi:hypothetical protein
MVESQLGKNGNTDDCIDMFKTPMFCGTPRDPAYRELGRPVSLGGDMTATQGSDRIVKAFGGLIHNTLRIGRWLTLAVVFLSLMGLRLAAQSGNARVTGTVTDATGAAIPGATITLTNIDTNAVSKVTSGGNGDSSGTKFTKLLDLLRRV